MGRFTGIIMLVLAVVLAGCKADLVEINLTGKQIYAAAKGQESTARFTAVFSNVGTLDQDSRQKMKQISDMIAGAFEDAETELEKTSMGYKFVVSGLIPVSGSAKNIKSPWFISVEPVKGFGPFDYLLQVRTSRAFKKFKQKINSISFMLAPEAAQPVKIKIKAEDFRLIAPAVQINGESFLMRVLAVEDRANLVFKGGVFDQIGAGFVFKSTPGDQ